jgi:hypothetical protein
MKETTRRKLDDATFNKCLPENIRAKSVRFFTPKEVAIQSAKWLSGDDNRRILDIGAGVGKFCLFGAYYTKSEFLGIEIRHHLVDIAEKIFDLFNVTNAKIIRGNILDFQFSDYDAFYLYNPYHENIVPFLRMDDTVLLSQEIYHACTKHTMSQLARAKPGTRLVTYFGTNFDVPSSYRIVEEFNGGILKYWIKTD